MHRFIILFMLPLLVYGQSPDFPTKTDLKQVYAQAIASYIKAVNDKHKTSFDTLYFGKHVYGQPDDFPDIELPESIENTHIRLVSPEAGLKIQKARKSLVYINLFGWVDKTTAEFIFVTFSNGCEHQHDCHIDYQYDSIHKSFNSEKVRFEYFRYKPNQK